MKDKANKQAIMKTMTRADFLTGAAAVLAAAFGFAWMYFKPVRPAAEVVVFKYNQEVLRKSLADSGEEIWIFGEPGRQNAVQRIGRRVRVVKADCPDQLCVKQGWIEKTGDQLLCIPNQLLVEIRSKGAEAIDAVAR